MEFCTFRLCIRLSHLNYTSTTAIIKKKKVRASELKEKGVCFNEDVGVYIFYSWFRSSFYEGFIKFKH